jgi:hypothetical protein
VSSSAVGGITRTALARAGLLLAAVFQAEIGIWGLIAPHSLWADYPGAGHHWIAPMGPYDQHLIRDFAAAELGFAVLLVCAAIWFERRLVLAAGAAFLTATIPHFAYHLTTTSMLSSTDNVISLGGFALEMIVVVAAMGVAAQSPKSLAARSPKPEEPWPA